MITKEEPVFPSAGAVLAAAEERAGARGLVFHFVNSCRVRRR